MSLVVAQVVDFHGVLMAELGVCYQQSAKLSSKLE